MPRSLLLLAASTLRSLAFVLTVVAALVVLNDRAWATQNPPKTLCYNAKAPCTNTYPCVDDNATCTAAGGSCFCINGTSD